MNNLVKYLHFQLIDSAPRECQLRTSLKNWTLMIIKVPFNSDRLLAQPLADKLTIWLHLHPRQRFEPDCCCCRWRLGFPPIDSWAESAQTFRGESCCCRSLAVTWKVFKNEDFQTWLPYSRWPDMTGEPQATRLWVQSPLMAKDFSHKISVISLLVHASCYGTCTL